MPLTLKDDSRLVEPSLFTAIPERRTPGASNARSGVIPSVQGQVHNLLGTDDGSAELVSVFKAWTAPVTVTLSVTAPTSRVKSTRWRALTVTVNASACALEARRLRRGGYTARPSR